MGIPGEVPRNHKDSMPVVKERTYIHPQKYRDGYGKITNYSDLVHGLGQYFITYCLGRLGIMLIPEKSPKKTQKKKSKKRGSGSVTSNLALGKVLARKEALKLFVTTLVTKTFALESSSLH
ncbi:hypothetical protein MKW92_029373 [Papaver armeniacum]|nr:hypothetical protein MKW92_029373 [Papaver armeniacum]